MDKTKVFLSPIMDLFNNQIITYQVGTRNDIDLVEYTVHQAIKEEGTVHPILHSDQGVRYRSNRYHELIKLYDLTASISRKGNCIDNACIKSFFSHFKEEAFTI